METVTETQENEGVGSVLLAQAMCATLAPTHVEAGEVLARQGQPGERFCYVESGAIDIVITSENGLRLPVARLGPGNHFGEMSLLCDMPVSADVVAAEPSVIYAANIEQFNALKQQKPELVEYIAGELAARLKRTNEQLAAQQQRQAVLNKLISHTPDSHFLTDLPSLGKKFAAVVYEAAESEEPLLIEGEKGIGKRALALHIHATGPRQERAVVVVECRELPHDKSRSLLFGDADPGYVSRFAERLGYLQAADRGTLILANVDRLPVEVQEDMAAFLARRETPADNVRVDVRVVATVEPAPEGEFAQNGLTESLRQALGESNRIEMKPLRKRRRDVIPLAEHFLQHAAEMEGLSPRQFSESAKRKLAGYDFHLENAEELRRSIVLSVKLAGSDTIGAEHLFFGTGFEAETPHIDLLRWQWLEQALGRGRLMVGARVLVSAVFLGIVAACLLLSSSLVGKIANAMVWGLWWPALIVLSVMVGRLWCAVCPLSTGADAVQKARGRELSPPSRLNQTGPSLALIGFAAIIWIEHTAGMSTHPRATAALLVGLAAIAALVGWMYQRHTWCRYLCPLGAMCGSFSTGSALRVRARREVCAAVCSGNQCFKGSEQVRGCPMFNHVMAMNDGQHCKLCFECIRSCPAQSPRLVLQLPLRDVWRAALVPVDAAPVIIVVGLLALLLAASPLITAVSSVGHLWFTAGTIVAVAIGLAWRQYFKQEEQKASLEGILRTTRIVYAYAFSVAAALLAYQLSFFPGLDAVSVGIGIGGPAFSTSLLHAIQAAVLAIGAGLTTWTLWCLCRKDPERVFSLPRLTIIPLAIPPFAYLVVVLVLLAIH